MRARSAKVWLTVVLGAVILLVSGCAGLLSSTANPAPGTAPSITTQPENQNVLAGATATFSVVATGSVPLNFQWQENGTPITGANASSYTTPVTTTADNNAMFQVVISNAAGSVTSAAGILTVTPDPVAPAVTKQPASVAVMAGQTASFSVAVSGTQPLTYQWQKNGAAISGATSNSYVTPPTTIADNGSTFAVAINNAAGATSSSAAMLTVDPDPVAPSIVTQPVNQSVLAGQTATFSVAASGTQPFSYQWSKNGAAISGAVSASYTTPVTTSADNGSAFQVTVTNTAGSTPSGTATLTVTPDPVAPGITSQPVSATVTAGQTATFSVSVSGTQPISLQWLKNGAAISGATATSYTTPPTTTNDNGSTFQVIASNTAGSTPSAVATLTVNPAPVPPSFTAQPVNATVTAGQTATFSAAASGTQPLNYQWQKNGAAIAGATASSYTTPATTTNDNGSMFQVVVSNTAGTITSNAAILTVNAAPVAPTFTTQPASVTVPAGQTATFTAAASGTAPLSYQWQKNGAAIGGATASSYTTPATTTNDNGSIFVVVVSNSAGSVPSAAATLTVNPAPVAPSITSQPANATVTAGQTATFTVVASGTAPLSYQWSKNGGAIGGAIAASYTTPATTTNDNGSSFAVVVTNSVGSTPSAAATLTVNAAAVAPSITTQPANATVTAGQTATFTVVASGTAPLSYQWSKNGGAIGGATAASYTTPATTTNDNGSSFTVVVTNSAGSAPSAAATLTVNPAPVAPSITTQPANATVTAGQTATFTVVASGTAPLSYQWSKNNSAISGATAASYTIPATTAGDNGSTFQVMVSNSTGNASSNSATLTVNTLPSFTTQPANATVTAGQTATFTVVAAGTSPLSYQWQKNGTAISGATSTSYTTPVTKTTDNGATFAVVATNVAGSTTSSGATLTVNADTTPPTVSITSPTAGATISGTTTITATASDNIAVANVQFQVDAANVGSPVTTTPYTYSLSTTTLSNGAHTLTAVATDTSGNSTTSAGISVTVSNSSSNTLPGPLSVSKLNPRYFTTPSGNVVLLAGSHTWENLEDQGTPAPATFDYDGYMSWMKGHGFNFMHMWTWVFPNGGTANEAPIQYTAAPYPWVRTGPGTANDGGPQFDLTQLDPNYFSRLRARIIEAGQNGIYVSIYLFNGYEWQFDVNGNDGNPFEAGNNVNGVNCPNTCPTDNSKISSQVWTFEQQYISQVINTVNDLNNVLYAVSNESPSPGSDTWQASVISYVRSVEAGLPNQHPVGMVFQFQGGTDQKLYNSAADWVSPAYGGGGLNVPNDATGQCPRVTGNGGAANTNSPTCKVVINDTDHDCGICGSQAWVWENFTRGNSTLFMDQYLVYAPSSSYPGYDNNPGPPCTNNICSTVDPQWDPTRNAMGDILLYGNSKIDLVNMTPQDSLSSSGFCLANAGSQYLVYAPSGNFTLTTVAGTYTFEWFNPSTHAVASTGSITVGTSQSFTAPFGGDAVLWLHK